MKIKKLIKWKKSKPEPQNKNKCERCGYYADFPEPETSNAKSYFPKRRVCSECGQFICEFCVDWDLMKKIGKEANPLCKDCSATF